MERIKQMTDTRRCAFLWAVTVLLTAALLFLCGGKVHAQEEDDDWMRDTFSRYTMAAMISGKEGNYFNDSEKPDALTVLNYTAYKMYQVGDIDTISFDEFYKDYVCANFSAVVDKESLKNAAELDNGTSIFFDYKSDTDEISIHGMSAGGDSKRCVYIGWQDNNNQIVLYGMWKDPEPAGEWKDYYVTLTISGYGDDAKIVSYQKIENNDVKFSSEFFTINYDDNGYDEINCKRELNGKTRIVLPCYEEVHCRAAMTYQNERVETTGLAGIKVTSSDEDIVSVYDNNENYEEISSVSGDKVGTVKLTCEFKSRKGETVYTEILPCDVAKFEAGRDNARYDSYGMCVLYNTDVEIFAKIEGLDEYKEQDRFSYEWKSAEIPEIDGKTTESVRYTAPNNEKKAEISVDIYIDGEKITTQSVSLKVKNGVLDYKVYEMPGTAMKEQDTTAPLLLNKRYFIDLAGGDFGWDYGNNAEQCFSSWEFTMDGKTFTITDKEAEDYDTPIQQPDFMTYDRGIAGGATPNCLFIVKKAGQLTVTGTIYQNNKVFRTISKTFTVKSENTKGTTPKPQQPAQPASLQKGTKVADKKSKAVYKVNGNKTVEYNKANKKAKKATVPSTITVNGVKYQVTSIAAKAFANNKKLTKVVIPASVRSIGKQAFSGCKNLKSITIKTTYLTKKSVGAKAFKGIHAKATIKVPKKQKKAYQKFLKTKGIGKGVKIK